MPFPPHYAYPITATTAGTLIRGDAAYLSVTSSSQAFSLRLPFTPYLGQIIQGYVGAYGFTLTGVDTVNGSTSLEVPPFYYFSAIYSSSGAWIVDRVDNIGQAGGYPAFGNFPITGQSYMSGRGTNSQPFVSAGAGAQMFGNDYVLKTLADPVDSDAGQVDTVSSDATAGGSFYPQLASRLLAANGSKPLTIIPNPKGGTQIIQWQPGANHTDRNTLYGSSVFRSRQVGNLAYNLCMIGASDAVAGVDKATFKSLFSVFAAAFRTDLGIQTVLGKFPYPNDAAAIAGLAPIYAAIDELISGENADIVAGPDLSGVVADDDFHYKSDIKLSWESDQWLPILQRLLGQQQGSPSANLVSKSEQFDQWSVSNTIVTANVAPSPTVGGSAADRITCSGTTGVTHTVLSATTIPIVSGQPYVLGIRLKAESGVQWVQPFASSATFGTNYANFDILNGVVGNGTSDALIRSIGNGWFECQVLGYAVGTGNAQMVINAVGSSASGRASVTGPNTGRFLVAGAQVNARRSLAAYQETT